MHKQEIFDTVVNHLINQKQKSVKEGNKTNCLYRGPNGLKCAVGCLIPDDVYEEYMEENFTNLLSQYGDVLPFYFNKEYILLYDLQLCHDNCPTTNDNFFNIYDLKNLLNNVGARYKLNIRVLDQIVI